MRSLDHDSGLFETLQKVGALPTPVRDGQLHASDSTEVVEDVEHEEKKKVVTLASVPLVNISNVFRHPDTHPLILDLLLMKQYGADWLDWEPETIEAAIVHDFPKKVSAQGYVSELNLTKLNACKALHLVDTFWQRWEVFTWCAMPFNGVFPDFRVMQAPTVGQMLVAVDIANRIREDVAWSNEMQAFMKTVYLHDGMLVPLPPADFFNIDHGSLEAECHEIDLKWPEVRVSGKAPSGDTLVAEQLRRMLHVNQYLEESRSRLHQQMELVQHADL